MRHVLSVIAVLAAIFFASKAHAMGPSAGLLVGNGFKDGYNLGIGARAGVTLPVIPVYVGGTFVYHFGKTDSALGVDVNTKVLYVGAEGGYETGIFPLTLRPYVGLGYASVSGSIGDFSSSSGKFAVWPGLTALVSLVGVFVGLDGRYVIVTDTGDTNFNAFSLFATAGLSF